jgi:hypothetical protein
MQSKLSLSEFRTRLKTNTQIGSPRLKLSPFSIFTIFDGHSKLFYGLFDDKGFRLTMNSTMSPTYFIIKGRYKIIKNILTVNYEIEPHPKFYLAWMKYLPIIIFISINVLLLSSGKTPKEAFIPINIFFLFMVFFSRWHVKQKRKNIEQKFIEIFEIE